MKTTAKRREMKIGTRLGIGFSLVFLLMIGLTVLSIIEVNAIENNLRTINDINSVKQDEAVSMRSSIHERAIALRDMTLVDQAGLSDALNTVARLDRQYRESQAALAREVSDGRHTDADEQALFAAIDTVEGRVTPLVAQAVAMRQAGQADQAREFLLSRVKPEFVNWLQAINNFISMETRKNQQESDKARHRAAGFEAFMVLLCLIAIGIGSVVAMLVVRRVKRIVGAEPWEVTALAQAVDRGELYRQVDTPETSHGQASIMGALASMSRNLKSTVTEVRRTSEQVAVTSRQIVQGNLDLSERTENQAGSLQVTASTMEQLTATVKSNADSAGEANRLAVSASNIAVEGGAIVEEVVQTMNSIDESSRKIVDIIAVIDGIAFQTNILALNAAVEAARAGELGRGFAVVATEVRTLAQRSSAAAKEIKSLIDDSVAKVELGSELVKRAGLTMQEVVGSVRHVTDVVGEISAASVEQSAGIAEVNRAIARIDLATQQNAALVEEATVAANALRTQADTLSQVVGFFKLDEFEAETIVAEQQIVMVPAARKPKPGASIRARRPALGMHAVDIY
ncbi:methyl-accepting chemotaxis protein [Herbaspirillum sp. meg3]|uniref:methyl-accepting chemotaxis protein n=1 Tax=Herbaspirillum sp. meg3 TaxID=2025949 RepID=UPI0018DFADE6|nr:methyl-accepting chemotaxis protein [Herbaspirillum sp. meg3]